MSKTRIFFILIVIFLLFIFFVYGNIENKIEEDDFSGEIEIVHGEFKREHVYSIIDIDEEKIIKNDGLGLEFSIPIEWNVEIVDDEYDYAVEISSPDLVVDGYFPEKGCMFGSNTKYYKEVPGYPQRPELIQEKISRNVLDKESQEIATITNGACLKTTRISEDKKIILVEIPDKNKVHLFGSFIAGEDKDKCTEEFTRIIEEIKIY